MNSSLKLILWTLAAGAGAFITIATMIYRMDSYMTIAGLVLAAYAGMSASQLMVREGQQNKIRHVS
jgi:hypothetical protein